MRTRSYTLLLHPLFLLSLVLLLLNDFYLKYEFHNWLTGKLSDFAGLFVFAIFLVVLFPQSGKPAIIFCALFFCWWKSSLSNSFIHFVNSQLSLPVHRVVDYTDLFALLVLPLADRITPPEYPASFIRTAAIYATGIVSFLSFCATSMIPRQMAYYPYRENEVTYNMQFNSRLSRADILERLDPKKLGYKKDSVRFYRVAETGDFFQRITNSPDSTIIWAPVVHNTDTTLFVRKREGDFFILPWYELEGDTLYNLEFSVYKSAIKKKPTAIQIKSFQTKNPALYKDFYNGSRHKRYKKHFKDLFRK
ncbi:MAG: hypothetical protein WDO71_07120 [Bacteroidota bacterium]